jgi:hypothetical protein
MRGDEVFDKCLVDTLPRWNAVIETTMPYAPLVCLPRPALWRDMLSDVRKCPYKEGFLDGFGERELTLRIRKDPVRGGRVDWRWCVVDAHCLQTGVKASALLEACSMATAWFEAARKGKRITRT